jgi:CubicO group peptidase (beta-lactamase class C family)
MVACSTATEGPGPLPVNTDLSREWPTATPAEQGMDAARLQVAYQVARSQPHLKSLLVVRNGFLVAEEYFTTDDDTAITNIHSVTKSFMSALVGIAIRDGHIASVNQSIADYLVPGIVPSMDDAHRAITIRHLLTMTSGLQWDESAGGESEAFASSGLDAFWEYTLSKPVVDVPGSRVTYNSGNGILLSLILTQATGMSTLDYARDVLLAPLGIDSLAWYKDGEYWNGGSRMWMRPRDMAKLGTIYVNGGRSNGQQVIPADWIHQSLTPVTALGVPYRYGPINTTNYGFLWWIDREPFRDAFFAWGWGGQFIYCVPALELVVVTSTNSPALDEITRREVEKSVLELIIDRVLPAVVGG